jgi:sigma-E factor negative regulatory protein RseB
MICRLLLPLLLVWPGLVIADQDARSWLERMIQATHSLDYYGTFVYIQGHEIDVMSILHSNAEEQESQRMYSLNGPPREVVVRGDEVICLLPDQQIAFKVAKHERSPFPISFPRDLERLSESYRFEMLGTDRVAERNTRVVAVQPHDQYRYGYHLWLDEETGLVLRSTLIDAHDQVLEQLIFTRLHVVPRIEPELLLPHSEGYDAFRIVSTPFGLEPEQKRPSWQVSRLPSGFSQIMYQWYPAGNPQQHVTEQMVFSDGLATVSVFVEQLDGDPLLEGASRMDAVNAHGVVVDGHQVLVVGEVPPDTLASIALSIEPAESR